MNGAQVYYGNSEKRESNICLAIRAVHMPIFDALLDIPEPNWFWCDTNKGGHMADGYARTKSQVMLVTSGPGSH